MTNSNTNQNKHSQLIDIISEYSNEFGNDLIELYIPKGLFKWYSYIDYFCGKPVILKLFNHDKTLTANLTIAYEENENYNIVTDYSQIKIEELLYDCDKGMSAYEINNVFIFPEDVRELLAYLVINYSFSSIAIIENEEKEN